jgi:hypothetical protein
MSAPICNDAPCRSPIACAAFGYCRNLNTTAFYRRPIEERRELIRARRKAMAQ